MKLQLDAMAAAKRRDSIAAMAAADELERLAGEPGQHPLAQTIITLQARQTRGLAAHAAGDEARVVEMMNAAVEIEDSIEALSQPPYPILPAHELYGTILMAMNRPAEASKQFMETLKRTPARPMAIYGLARAAESLGDSQTARARYTEFLDLWKDADKDRPELAAALRYLRVGQGAPR
jgi:tetratricopeptide (TPR) repeat protein